MKPKLPCGTLDKLHADPKNWRTCSIYVCKDDPRFIVPKTVKWCGWTLNFAHRSAWLALAIVILAILVPTILMAEARLIGTWIWFAFLGGIIVAACLASWMLASPKRCEAADQLAPIAKT